MIPLPKFRISFQRELRPGYDDVQSRIRTTVEDVILIAISAAQKVLGTVQCFSCPLALRLQPQRTYIERDRCTHRII